jgi:methyl-accepting chemotaxis protein
MERQQESINSLTIAQEETNMALKTSDQQKQIVESLTEKTVSGMEQMSATVKITASRSTTADGLSSKTAALVKDGAVLSGKAKGAMQQISADNEKISKIVKVVNKIAFQTNLLAINAAIEAAKAGESGSGFSVVAAEVRNLAKNSSDAANEINDLIIKSISGIQNGVMLVDDNAKKLSEIDENISQFIAIVKEIFATTNEQQQMVDSINDFMQELNAAVLALREEN